MADAVVTMGARWDGKQLKRGLDETRRGIAGVRSSVKSLSAVVGGPLGLLGITTAAFGLARAFNEIGQEQLAMRRLETTIERISGQAPNMAMLNSEFVKLRDNSLRGDTEIASGYQNLVSLTGDWESSLGNLSLALDIAADRQMSLQQSTKLVAFAMKGEFEQLGEILPSIRQWARDNQDLRGTSEGAAQAIGILREQFGGAAAAEVDSYAGSVKQLSEAFVELRDSSLEVIATDPLLNKAMRGLANYIKGIAEDSRQQRAALRGELQMTATDFDIASGGSTSLYPYKNTSTGGSVFREAATATAEQAISEEEAAKAATERAQSYVKMLGVLDEWKQRGREMRGGGRGPDFVGLPGEGEDNPVFEKYKAQTQQMANELQGAFTGAFMSMRNGWEGLVDYMRDYLIQQLAISAAGALVGALIPGAGVAGGIFGGLFGGGTGNSVGASRAMQQQNAWRMQRSLR